MRQSLLLFRANSQELVTAQHNKNKMENLSSAIKKHNIINRMVPQPPRFQEKIIKLNPSLQVDIFTIHLNKKLRMGSPYFLSSNKPDFEDFVETNEHFIQEHYSN